ncbi:hypothetical protein QBC35DRAFT_389545 [Podospora australis]|uniref:Uncharacterized protein n=1 Tax=Podospora australis TaxID=1536484 RepID=A0AAN7AH04_9PEZI|nr:hypothetical protein QBC35DRAFT_389545 [Podospora australis]
MNVSRGNLRKGADGIHPPGPPQTSAASSFDYIPRELYSPQPPTFIVARYIPSWLNTFTTPAGHGNNGGNQETTATNTSAWQHLKVSLLSHGYPSAFTQILIAVVINHIRSILFPWLGTYLWYHHPLEDLRLARSNPEVFLDEMFSSLQWSWALGSFLHKGVVDYLAGVALACITKDTERREKNRGTEREREILKLYHVSYLLWIFSCLEYVFTRTVHTLAFALAVGKLLSGKRAEWTALGMVVKKHWHKVPIVVWKMGWYITYGILPLGWASVNCAVQKKGAGLLVAVGGAVGGVVGIILYRSVFYIALQVSGMFVALGLSVAGVVILGWEFWVETHARYSCCKGWGEESEEVITVDENNGKLKGV